MPSTSSTPTMRAARAPIPGTAWESGPDRLMMATYGSSPSATCCPA